MAKSVSTEGTVTVACNHVNGLVLKLYKMEDSEEPVLGGGTRVRKVAVEAGEPVTINGPRYSVENQQRGPSSYGYVLTPGVSAEFMAEWMKQNKDTLIVKNKVILIQEKKEDVVAEAKDNKGRLSGLEPITPGMDKDGKPLDARIPKPLKSAIGEVGATTTSDIN